MKKEIVVVNWDNDKVNRIYEAAFIIQPPLTLKELEYQAHINTLQVLKELVVGAIAKRAIEEVVKEEEAKNGKNKENKRGTKKTPKKPKAV